ncbi:MAG TPA: SMC-Scp complex subunit ScpB [Synergistaceae bacterium]|jgi:segregation and condensation protein B|nr:MAG: Condensin subunit ScpB [Synergistales bacterium 57_84]KUK88954.1 MAG: Condensin subunit ScpB [Synergistales bacterium 58_81]HBG14009.1 SMC-Scp complex subunit ScpB [Synergistaceae bacterium]HCP07686.1 SMC-Scp complex subunit ScpB [Synergistaceae bacterium]HCR39152.1 SMC-Scp complex subunit ScpB [Synergistaceae bacterium]
MSGYPVETPLSPIARSVEAVLFVAVQPVGVKELASVTGVTEEAVERALEEIKERYKKCHGLCLLNIAGGWSMATSPEQEEVVTLFRDVALSQRIRLSKAALESLAVIAYSQPVTRSEIEEIRGVRCERVLDTLLKHGLIRVAGRRKGSGTPLLYRTTDFFLALFGLGSISDLPTLDEMQDILSQDEYPKDGERAT